MSSITFFNRKNNRYGISDNYSSSISTVDEYGNYARRENLADNFYTNFLNYSFTSNVNSGLMPPGVRAIYPGIVVFERPPRMQMVQHISLNVEEICDYEHQEEDYPDVDTYYIPIPWQIYIASYTVSQNGDLLTNSVKMFFSKEPLTHSQVELFLPYIPNFFTNGTLCSPHFSDSDEIYRYPKDISGVIASAYDWVWNTGFNQDLIDGVSTNILSSVNNPIVNYVRTTDRSINRFYSKLSEYTAEEIVSFEWSPPSYTTYYDTTSEMRYLYTLPSLQQKYIDEYDIILEEEELFSEVVDFDDFSEWIYNVYSIKKTYFDIMNSVLYDTNNKSENNSNHRFSFNNALKLLPTESNFIHLMSTYINNYPL